MEGKTPGKAAPAEAAGPDGKTPPAAKPAAKPVEPESKRAALVRKLAAVIKSVGAVPKSGENTHFGYKFRRHEDITNKLQPALIEQGLVVVPVEKRMIVNEPGYILMEGVYEVTDGDASVRFIGIGEGLDKNKEGKAGDKAAYKAQTGAIKFALNDLLMLAGEDPENDRKTHDDEKKAAAGKRPTPPAPTAGQQQPTGRKDPTAPPQAKPAAYTLTEDQKSRMIDLMNALEYSPEKVERGLQKASIEGPDVAIAALTEKYNLWKRAKDGATAAPDAPGQVPKGGPAK